MTEGDIEIVLQRRKEQAADNTRQRAAVMSSVKEFIRISGITCFDASTYFLQSNGEIER